MLLVLLLVPLTDVCLVARDIRPAVASETTAADTLVLYHSSWQAKHIYPAWNNFAYATHLLTSMSIGHDNYDLDKRTISATDCSKYKIILIPSARDWPKDFAPEQDSIRYAVENAGVGLIVYQLPTEEYLTDSFARILGVKKGSIHESFERVQGILTSNDTSTQGVMGYFHSVPPGQYLTDEVYAEWSTDLTTAIPLGYYNSSSNVYYAMNTIGRGRVFWVGATINSGGLIAELAGGHNFEFVTSVSSLLPNWRRSSEYRQLAIMFDDLIPGRQEDLREILRFAKEQRVKVGLGAVISTMQDLQDSDKSLISGNEGLIELFYHGMYHRETYDGYSGNQDEFFYKKNSTHVPGFYQRDLMEWMIGNASKSGLRYQDYFVAPSQAYDNNTVTMARESCLSLVGGESVDLRSDLAYDPLLEGNPILDYNGTGVFSRGDVLFFGSNFTLDGLAVARSFLTLRIPVVLFGHVQDFEPDRVSIWRQVVSGARAIEPALESVFPSTVFSTYFTYTITNGATYFQAYMYGKVPVSVTINGTKYESFNTTTMLADLSKATSFHVIFQFPGCAKKEVSSSATETLLPSSATPLSSQFSGSLLLALIALSVTAFLYVLIKRRRLNKSSRLISGRCENLIKSRPRGIEKLRGFSLNLK